ncbi:MAG: carboxylate-amine ligase [Nocardioidaceae bacterium]
MGIRKIGVEEELQLVDPETGQSRPVSGQAVAADRRTSPRGDGGVEQELFLSQLEIETEPCQDLDTLLHSLRQRRRRAAVAAEEVGAQILAVPTPILGRLPDRVTPEPRYERIVRDFGLVGSEAGVTGMHVHIDVADDEEAVGVLDRIRPWLPLLLAISANSPYWLGVDTGHASWRAQVWGRWPAAGQSEPYGDVTGYRAATQAILDSGAAVDPAMLYLDARLATDLPTVEIRVSDVCTEVGDVCLVAALARALVDTAARDYAAGSPVPVMRTDLLRAGHWRASRFGMSHELVHPLQRRLVSARDAVEALIAHVHESMVDAGDQDYVTALFEELMARGSGAARQRSVVEAGGDLRAVVADLAERTKASWEATPGA